MSRKDVLNYYMSCTHSLSLALLQSIHVLLQLLAVKIQHNIMVHLYGLGCDLKIQKGCHCTPTFDLVVYILWCISKALRYLLDK